MIIILNLNNLIEYLMYTNGTLQRTCKVVLFI